MLKIQLCITGINYILKYINITNCFYIFILFSNITVIITVLWSNKCSLCERNGKFTLQRWHKSAFRCLYTDYSMLLRVGMNAFTQPLRLYTSLFGAELGLSRHNLLWLLCGIAPLHWVLSRHRAAIKKLCKPSLISKLYCKLTWKYRQNSITTMCKVFTCINVTYRIMEKER